MNLIVPSVFYLFLVVLSVNFFYTKSEIHFVGSFNCRLLSKLTNNHSKLCKSSKSKEPVLKVQDPVLKVQDPVLNHPDKVLQVQDPVFKVQDPVLKHPDKVLKVQDPVFKVQDPVLKVQPVLKHQGPILKHPEPVMTHLDQILGHQDQEVKHQDTVLRLQNPVTKYPDPVFKQQDPVLKHQKQMLKHQDPVLKHRENNSDFQGPVISMNSITTNNINRLPTSSVNTNPSAAQLPVGRTLRINVQQQSRDPTSARRRVSGLASGQLRLVQEPSLTLRRNQVSQNTGTGNRIQVQTLQGNRLSLRQSSRNRQQSQQTISSSQNGRQQQISLSQISTGQRQSNPISRTVTSQNSRSRTSQGQRINTGQNDRNSQSSFSATPFFLREQLRSLQNSNIQAQTTSSNSRGSSGTTRLITTITRRPQEQSTRRIVQGNPNIRSRTISSIFGSPIINPSLRTSGQHSVNDLRIREIGTGNMNLLNSSSRRGNSALRLHTERRTLPNSRQVSTSRRSQQRRTSTSGSTENQRTSASGNARNVISMPTLRLKEQIQTNQITDQPPRVSKQSIFKSLPNTDIQSPLNLIVNENSIDVGQTQQLSVKTGKTSRNQLMTDSFRNPALNSNSPDLNQIQSARDLLPLIDKLRADIISHEAKQQQTVANNQNQISPVNNGLQNKNELLLSDLNTIKSANDLNKNTVQNNQGIDQNSLLSLIELAGNNANIPQNNNLNLPIDINNLHQSQLKNTDPGLNQQNSLLPLLDHLAGNNVNTLQNGNQQLPVNDINFLQHTPANQNNGINMHATNQNLPTGLISNQEQQMILQLMGNRRHNPLMNDGFNALHDPFNEMFMQMLTPDMRMELMYGDTTDPPDIVVNGTSKSTKDREDTPTTTTTTTTTTTPIPLVITTASKQTTTPLQPPTPKPTKNPVKRETTSVAHAQISGSQTSHQIHQAIIAALKQSGVKGNIKIVINSSGNNSTLPASSQNIRPAAPGPIRYQNVPSMGQIPVTGTQSKTNHVPLLEFLKLNKNSQKQTPLITPPPNSVYKPKQTFVKDASSHTNNAQITQQGIVNFLRSTSGSGMSGQLNTRTNSQPSNFPQSNMRSAIPQNVNSFSTVSQDNRIIKNQPAMSPNLQTNNINQQMPPLSQNFQSKAQPQNVPDISSSQSQQFHQGQNVKGIMHNRPTSSSNVQNRMPTNLQSKLPDQNKMLLGTGVRANPGIFSQNGPTLFSTNTQIGKSDQRMQLHANFQTQNGHSSVQNGQQNPQGTSSQANPNQIVQHGPQLPTNMHNGVINQNQSPFPSNIQNEQTHQSSFQTNSGGNNQNRNQILDGFTKNIVPQNGNDRQMPLENIGSSFIQGNVQRLPTNVHVSQDKIISKDKNTFSITKGKENILTASKKPQPPSFSAKRPNQQKHTLATFRPPFKLQKQVHTAVHAGQGQTSQGTMGNFMSSQTNINHQFSASGSQANMFGVRPSVPNRVIIEPKATVKLPSKIAMTQAPNIPSGTKDMIGSGGTLETPIAAMSITNLNTDLLVKTSNINQGQHSSNVGHNVPPAQTNNLHARVQNPASASSTSITVELNPKSINALLQGAVGGPKATPRTEAPQPAKTIDSKATSTLQQLILALQAAAKLTGSTASSTAVSKTKPTTTPSPETTEEPKEIELEDMTTTTTTTTTTKAPPPTPPPSPPSSKLTGNTGQGVLPPGKNPCPPEKSFYQCRGRDMFINVTSVGEWCYGKCSIGQCVNAVCQCSCNVPPPNLTNQKGADNSNIQSQILGQEIASAMSGTIQNPSHVNTALNDMFTSLKKSDPGLAARVSAQLPGVAISSPDEARVITTTSQQVLQSAAGNANTQQHGTTKTATDKPKAQSSIGTDISTLLGAIERLIDAKINQANLKSNPSAGEKQHFIPVPQMSELVLQQSKSTTTKAPTTTTTTTTTPKPPTNAQSANQFGLAENTGQSVNNFGLAETTKQIADTPTVNSQSQGQGQSQHKSSWTQLPQMSPEGTSFWQNSAHMPPPHFKQSNHPSHFPPSHIPPPPAHIPPPQNHIPPPPPHAHRPPPSPFAHHQSFATHNSFGMPPAGANMQHSGMPPPGANLPHGGMPPPVSKAHILRHQPSQDSAPAGELDLGFKRRRFEGRSFWRQNKPSAPGANQSPHTNPQQRHHMNPHRMPQMRQHMSPHMNPPMSPHQSPYMNPHQSPHLSPHVNPQMDPHFRQHPHKRQAPNYYYSNNSETDGGGEGGTGEGGTGEGGAGDGEEGSGVNDR